jgi:hypothetical protein
MGELGHPRRKKPHRTVRTKYIGQRTDALLAEFDIWDAQAKYGACKIINAHGARIHCAIGIDPSQLDECAARLGDDGAAVYGCSVRAINTRTC